MKTLIKNVHVFDGRHSQVAENRWIVITDNKVTEIGTGDIALEQFDKVIDGQGQYAIPGLTDAHVHMGRLMSPDTSLEMGIIVGTIISRKLLDHGITTVRDAGGITQGLKKAIDERIIPGPRIFPSNAYISQTCGHGDSARAHEYRDIQYRTDSHVALADGPAEVLRAVREQLYRGASQIKIMAGGGLSSQCDPVATLQFTEEEMRAAVQAAADYGTYVMAHLYTSNCIQRAVRCGVKSLEHAHAMDEETARMVADAGVFVDPCPQFTEAEVRWNHMGKYSDYPQVKYAVSHKRGDSGKEVYSKIETTTEMINKYDIKILFGTDMMVMYPGYEPRQSLDIKEYKKRFGSYKGLLAATGNFNDIVQLTTYQNPYPDGEIGLLQAGSFADILIVKGNPVEDLDVLGDTENLLLVMKDGEVYKNTLV